MLDSDQCDLFNLFNFVLLITSHHEKSKLYIPLRYATGQSFEINISKENINKHDIVGIVRSIYIKFLIILLN